MDRPRGRERPVKSVQNRYENRSGSGRKMVGAEGHSRKLKPQMDADGRRWELKRGGKPRCPIRSTDVGCRAVGSAVWPRDKRVDRFLPNLTKFYRRRAFPSAQGGPAGAPNPGSTLPRRALAAMRISYAMPVSVRLFGACFSTLNGTDSTPGLRKRSVSWAAQVGASGTNRHLHPLTTHGRAERFRRNCLTGAADGEEPNGR